MKRKKIIAVSVIAVLCVAVFIFLYKKDKVNGVYMRGKSFTEVEVTPDEPEKVSYENTAFQILYGCTNINDEIAVSTKSVLDIDDIEYVNVTFNGKQVDAEITFGEDQFTVKPLCGIANGTYKINAITGKGKAYSWGYAGSNFEKVESIFFNDLGIAPAECDILKCYPVEGRFDYYYYLVLPKHLQTSGKRLIVEAPNTIEICDNGSTYRYVLSYFYKDMTIASRLFNELSMPILIPMFDNEIDNDGRIKGDIFQNTINKESLIQSQNTGTLSVDVQLCNMIKNAQETLAAYGYTLKDKVIMVGQAGCGLFASRFTMLHPDMVSASVCIGTAGVLPLPMDEYNGKKLNYPIGTGQLDLLDKEVDVDEYLKVPQLCIYGTNQDLEVFYEDELSEIKDVYGGNASSISKKSVEIWSSLTSNVVFKDFTDYDRHWATEDMIDYAIEYLKSNWR